MSLLIAEYAKLYKIFPFHLNGNIAYCQVRYTKKYQISDGEGSETDIINQSIFKQRRTQICLPELHYDHFV